RLRFSPSSGTCSTLERNSTSAAFSRRPRSKNGPTAATLFTSWNRTGSPTGSPPSPASASGPSSLLSPVAGRHERPPGLPGPGRGAGPTGLVLAAELLARGITARILDKGDGVILESRVAGIHAPPSKSWT